MSQIVRQEKGRELAALVLERERKRARLRARKNLGKYHMIRFIERQKCERALKALRKSLEQAREIRRRREQQAMGQEGDQGTDTDTDMDDDGGAKLPSADEVHIEEQIRQAEVDLNYTIYAPLGEKYISLFPATGKEKLAGMSGISKYHLKPEEEAEIRRLKDDNVVRNATGEKPPMWEMVRELMEKGTPLEQLRDGKLTSAPITLPQVGGKDEAVHRVKPTPAWMADDGTIAPEDQDSEDSEFFE